MFCGAIFTAFARTGSASVGAFGADDDPESLEDDQNVEPDRPVVDVEHVEANFVVVAGGLSTHHLPKPGEAGLDREQFGKKRAVVGALRLSDGSWTDEADVAAQNAEER